MRGWIVVLSAFFIVASASSAKADRRVAFVVGNGSYANMPHLANAPGDAKAMATLLRKLDFDVVQGINVSRDQMTERLLEFGKKADGADLALFYYAGQGVALGGVSYLLPVDASIKSEMDLKLGSGINLDTALDQTMSGASVKLVFVDASSSDPLAASGRAPAKPVSAREPVETGVLEKDPDETKTPRGMIINYATGPGQTASDGKKGGHRPFTQALLDHIAESGVEIQAAMTKVAAEVNDATNKAQMPWGHARLVGEVYLNPAAPGTPAGAK